MKYIYATVAAVEFDIKVSVVQMLTKFYLLLQNNAIPWRQSLTQGR